MSGVPTEVTTKGTAKIVEASSATNCTSKVFEDAHNGETRVTENFPGLWKRYEQTIVV
jgi:hypothetical protein